jgi:hypothetical protein
MDDYYVRESQKLNRYDDNIDTFIAQGSSALQNLREQGSMLKVCCSAYWLTFGHSTRLEHTSKNIGCCKHAGALTLINPVY